MKSKQAFYRMHEGFRQGISVINILSSPFARQCLNTIWTNMGKYPGHSICCQSDWDFIILGLSFFEKMSMTLCDAITFNKMKPTSSAVNPTGSPRGFPMMKLTCRIRVWSLYVLHILILEYTDVTIKMKPICSLYIVSMFKRRYLIFKLVHSKAILSVAGKKNHNLLWKLIAVHLDIFTETDGQMSQKQQIDL